jgi:hypothetical protein
MWKAVAYRSAILLLALAAPSLAADGVKVETLLTGLSNPCGVAIRPAAPGGQEEVFVADSGALKVVRVPGSEPGQPTDVVTGFTEATFGEEPIRVGPLALLFLDRDHLLVGASGNEGRASVRMYELPDPPRPLSAAQAQQQVDFPADGAAAGGADHVYSMVRTRANDHVPDAVILASFRNDRSGMLRKIAVRAGTLGDLQTFHDEKNRPGEPADVGLAERGYIVAGQAGTLDKPRDSWLDFFNPIDGARVMELPIDLYDVVALAYSPTTGSLYAADIAWMAPDEGGIFRVDDLGEAGKPRCVPVRMAEVNRPSALAFAPDGTLYVTAFGKPNGDETNTGVLLKITGEL